MSPKNSDNTFSLWTKTFLRLPKFWAFCTLNIRQGSSTSSMWCSQTSPKSAVSQPWAVQRPGDCASGVLPPDSHSQPSSSALGLFFGATTLCERLAMCNGPRWRARTALIISPLADCAASQTRVVPMPVTVKDPRNTRTGQTCWKIIAALHTSLASQDVTG